MSEDFFTIVVTKQTEEAKIAINRKLSPKTVALIEETIKGGNFITRAVNKGDNAIYIMLKIGRIGRENSTREITEIGTVAFYPASQLLIIYSKPKEINYDINIVGKVEKEDLDKFCNYRTGDPIKLKTIYED